MTNHRKTFCLLVVTASIVINFPHEVFQVACGSMIIGIGLGLPLLLVEALLEWGRG